MNLKGKIEIACQTDVGQVRDHNEDALSSDENIGLAVLADGMGGLNAGEVASSMSVHLLMDELRDYQTGDSTLEAELGATDDPVQAAVKSAIEKANRSVFHVSQTQAECKGMGTTVVVGLFRNNRLITGHIGDSRVYRFRADKLEQITRDHSFVQELIDQGIYTEDEARASNRKNVVTRALGVGPKVDVEVNEHKVKVGDIYLMCSDGLSDLVVDSNIETSLRELSSNLAAAAGHLVNLANASGGKDNISVVLCRVRKSFPEEGGLVNKMLSWFE
jgi:serine/threonine protein phosphatase PrpC